MGRHFIYQQQQPGALAAPQPLLALLENRPYPLGRHGQLESAARHAATGRSAMTSFEDLRKILAMFVAAPFVEVENAHIRQLNAEQDPGFLAGDRMAFAMRQLRVDTLSDIVDGLQATLTLSLFNYKPYSADFAYRGASPQEK